MKTVQSCRVRRGVRSSAQPARARKPGHAWRAAAVAAALGCAAALSACGGGGGASSPATTAVPAVKSVSIDAFGDSTMASYFNTPSGAVLANPTVTQMTQTGLQSTLGSGYQVTVTNRGVSGATLCSLLSGTGKFTTPLVDTLKTSGATYVLENFGMNDADPVVAGNESVTQFQQCLEQFVDTVRAAGKTPILEEPNPVGPQVNRAWGFDNANLANYVAMVDAVGQEKGVTVVSQYQYFQSLTNWPTLLSDGVHPTQDGYYAKAQREIAVLASIVH